MPYLKDDGTIHGLKPNQHGHVCGCGTFTVCADRDCAYQRDYQCDTCAQRQRDAYFTHLMHTARPMLVATKES